MRAASETDWAGVLESSGMGGANGVVLNDRLMTEASLGVISQLSSLGSLSTLGSISTILAAQQQETPTVKVEHSYSLSSERSEADSSLSGEAIFSLQVLLFLPPSDSVSPGSLLPFIVIVDGVCRLPVDILYCLNVLYRLSESNNVL